MAARHQQKNKKTLRRFRTSGWTWLDASIRLRSFGSTSCGIGMSSAQLQPQAISNVLVVPGNGDGGDPRATDFYGWAEERLQALGFKVVLPGPNGMPDPLHARRNIWLPYIVNEMGCTNESVVIGHSSGAVAALRLAETMKLRGIVLVAGYDEDLGDELERSSGYFSGPFDWQLIQSNCGFIVQFADASDELVPVDIQRRTAASLAPKCDYRELHGRNHSFDPPFEELIEAISTRCIPSI